ncbi:hypothetical protein Tco_0235771 [Tanacetum coccineum]
MAQLKYRDKHNQVGFLRKPDENAGFAEITATAKTLADGTLELKATIDTIEYTITEASIRSTTTLPITQPIPSEATTIPPLSQPAPPTPIAETTTASPSPSPLPAHEPMEHTFEQPSTDQQPPSPRQEATTSQLMTRIGDLEKQLKETKQTFGKAILTLVERVKTLEVALKRKTKRVLLSDSEEEETEAQGRKTHDLDPLVSLHLLPDRVERRKGSMTEKKETKHLERQKNKSSEEAGLAAAIRLDALKKLWKRNEVAQTNYAKRMVELVNQRRKHFAEERARAKRNKPMTQTQLRNYMSNFLKNQGTWKLTQLKKLNFEEVKAEFEKLSSTKTAKKLKFDDEGTQPTEGKIEEDKDDKPTKKTRKRRKQIARKGFHTYHDKDESEDSDEANEKDDSTLGVGHEETCMNEPEDVFEKVLWETLKNIVHCLNLESADVYMLIERKYPLSAEVCKAMLDKKLQGGKPDEDCYKLLKMMEKQAVEMVFSQPWTCTFLVAKGLTTPELMANWTSNLASNGANFSGSSFWNVETSSTSTTLIVDYPGDHNSEDKVESVDNNMTRSMASERVGFGAKSLLEQWRDSYENGDYDEDLYR